MVVRFQIRKKKVNLQELVLSCIKSSDAERRRIFYRMVHATTENKEKTRNPRKNHCFGKPKTARARKRAPQNESESFTNENYKTEERTETLRFHVPNPQVRVRPPPKTEPCAAPRAVSRTALESKKFLDFAEL